MDRIQLDIGASRPSLHPDLGDASCSVHAQFDEQMGQAEVDHVLDQVAGQFTDAPIRAFVPLFVQRLAKEELTRRAAAGGTTTAAVPRSA
ncbi:three-helix bundle dimerization domain-containing protein [Angustibacter sp. McL0619]|uniref:three-helix bundle dimerization domain-containing protein n=1 Tax=Angustibacter sp. McL0619 TaxID=3415676 RepID=UPI003CF65770